MSVFDSLRSGLKFFLMSLGISSPPKKPQAAARSATKPEVPK
ncbi:MAG TPA: hypothetical protein VFE01_10055 [Terracidiphilus sp.]|jgi:hypothetical protein|nr:hypothetical protein [Terracidiphilus sp.]